MKEMEMTTNLLNVINTMSQIIADKDKKIAALINEIGTLETKLAQYEEKELFEVVGTSNFGDQIFNIYEKFVPDFVTDEDINQANLIAPKFESVE